MRTNGPNLTLLILTLALAACGEGVGDADQTSQNETVASCSAAEQQAALERMLTQPVLPYHFAGVDINGGEGWTGLKIESSFATLCQPASSAPGAGTGTERAAWGGAKPGEGPVALEFDTKTRVVNYAQLSAGYKGTLEFDGGGHHYTIGLGAPITRDGVPMAVDWNDFRSVDRFSTELYNAVIGTFAPEWPRSATSCKMDRTCLARILGEIEGKTTGAVFGVRPLGLYFHIPDATTPANAATPDYFYAFTAKLMPFSFPAKMFLQLDDVGPTASVSPRCEMKLGQPFSEFLSGCVDLSDPAGSEKQRKKLLAGVKLDPASSTWKLDVVGTHLNFESLSPGEASPAPTAKANEWILDGRAWGEVTNDYRNDGAFTMPGTSAVYREYARLVQQGLHAKMAAQHPELPRFGIGATECLLPAGGDPGTWRPAPGCTGMESFITPAMPDTGDPGVDRVSVGANIAVANGESSIVGAGSGVNGTWCVDPGSFAHCGFDDDILGSNDRLWEGSSKRVLATMGKNAPALANDVGFFVDQFSQALITYYRAASRIPTDLSQLGDLAPRPGEVVRSVDANSVAQIRYRDKLELTLDLSGGFITGLTLRR